MDYRTKVTITSALLGLLTLTAVLGFVFSGQSVAQRQAQEALLSGFAADQVGGISLPDGIELTRTTAWALSVSGKTYDASQDRIDEYLKTLAGLHRDRLVGHSVALADFGLDKPKSILIKDKAGKTLFTLLTGSSNTDGTKVYVKLGESNDVWETDRGLTRPLDVDFNTWADLSLAPGKKAEDLTRATYQGTLETSDKTKYSSFDLVKSGTPDKPVWQNQLDKAKTDATKAGTWANQAANFHFGAYFGPSETAVVDGKGGKLVLEWGNNTKTELTFGTRDSQNRIPATDGKRQFWINDWALGQLLYKP